MFYGHGVCSEKSDSYVIGIDAGGTRTRAAVVTLDGLVAGYGTGPGANPNSGNDAVTALATALRAAVTEVDRTRVVGGVFGIAGAGAAGRPKAVSASNAAWLSAELPGDGPEVVTDIAVAFAAGTALPSGIVVFAGTGAGAAVIDDGTIARRADAYGWLVGDEGSAVWIGRAAVRAVLRACDERGPATALTGGVTDIMLGADAPASSSDLPQALVKEVYGNPPAALGRLAPAVGAAAADGDPVARDIVAEAASHLLTDVDAVRPALAGREDSRGGIGLVTAGSLLETGPVAEAVRAGLRERFGMDPAPAGDGAVGAARIALRRLGR